MAAVQSVSSSGGSQGQEFVVRIPKTSKKRYHVMRFNGAHNQDVSKWTQVRMERENNMKEFKAEEELPKFGAGSEFGREQKEEARRKKYGIIVKKYNPDEQPWLIKIGGKTGKKFKGIREGGVSDNTSYYVFCKAPDGVFEAFPVEEWYNFNPVGRFKALTAEEAEEEFEKRDKVMNHFSIMVRKKMAADDGGLREEGEEKKGRKEKKDFKISDMDDWLSDADADAGGSDDEKEEDDDGKKKKGEAKKKARRKSDDEPVEESDEGDFDDREVDYMSASSSEAEEPEEEKAGRELKGVEDEEALREADQSEEEGEGEKEEEKGAGSEEEASKDDKGAAEARVKGKAEKKEAAKPAAQAASSGESTSESSDSDFDDSKFQSAMFMQKPKSKKGSDSATSSRANTPTKHVSEEKKGKSSSKAQKRKAKESPPSGTDSPKRMRHEAASSAPATPNMWSGSTEGITEESVRRYLLRKPMTTTELLQKFKSKKTGMSSDKLVNTIAQILKKLNPVKQTIKGKLYLSIKP